MECKKCIKSFDAKYKLAYAIGRCKHFCFDCIYDAVINNASKCPACNEIFNYNLEDFQHSKLIKKIFLS